VPAAAPGGKGLRAGSLGLISSVVIAVSSTAPAYSMAATLGLIIAIVGVHSPGTLIASFLPMLCIAYAFRELNKVDPDCGTTFTWTTRAFGPLTGWMGGWGIIAADVIVMASLSQIAGRYALLLVGADGLAAQTLWVTAGGLIFIGLLTWICRGGVRQGRHRPWPAGRGSSLRRLAEPVDRVLRQPVELVPARRLHLLGLGLRAQRQ
jgi:amino acid transporter